jgi:eukaryotic-like serine/threonine-protein kinase
VDDPLDVTLLGERLAKAENVRRPDPLRVELARARSRASLFGEQRGETRLGRYVVLERIGHGAMGVVYSAYDPELDRKVAIKVLSASALGSGGEQEVRLVREARALAKLEHPNVVAVYDVGTVDGADASVNANDDVPLRPSVFIAMQLIDGVTMAHWIAERPRAWTQVLAAMIEAGRGLAAAHAAGLVHRDFKPDNVMVARDPDGARAGRVQVTDFGLARPCDGGQLAFDATISDCTGPASEGPLSLRATISGAIVGTPGYMAPEQFAGRGVDAASDQFSFCVSLWEAFYGRRPFAGDSLVELAARVLQGELLEPPRRSAVPHWVRRALERGLAVDPARRWPSMNALLLALSRGQKQARLRAAITIGAAVGAVGLGGLLWQHEDVRRRTAQCEAEGSEIESVWNDERRATLRDALVATDASYAVTTVDNTIPWLDQQAGAWSSARTSACLHATVHEEWDDTLLERSLWCLDDRRIELDTLVTELSRGEPRALQKAVQAAAGLARIEPCIDRDQLSRQPEPPTEGRVAVEQVRIDLSRAAALRVTGAYADGLAVARATLQAAETLGAAPLVAAARLEVGRASARVGTFDLAEDALVDAYFEAADAGAIEVATAAAEELVYVDNRLRRHDDALVWSRHAELHGAVLPDPGQLRLGGNLAHRALVHESAGEYAAARELLQRALVIREEGLGPEHPDVAATLGNLARVHRSMGEHADALRLATRSLTVWEVALGPEHPNVATALGELGVIRASAGEYREAIELVERGVAIQERALGPDHPDLSSMLGNLAEQYRHVGAYERSQALHERALAIRERVYGPNHLNLAGALNNLANLHETMGDLARAKRLHERALAIRENALGRDHPDVAESLHNLGNLQLASGDTAEAQASFERAVVIFEKALGPDHPTVAYPVFGLATIALSRGSASTAVELAERALALRVAAAVPAAERAESQFLLAQALWAAGDDRARAIALAEAARDTAGGGGEATAAKLATIAQWLASHRSRK